MTKKAQALLAQALTLAPDERLKLGRQIEESVEGSDESLELSPEWCEEIDRRIARVASGKAKGMSGEDAIASVRRALNDQRATRGKKPSR
jgi:putative addiction module component (TIGR02574 family)